MSFALIIVSLTLVANLLIAFFVFFNNKNSATNILLATLSIISALWTFFTYLALFSTPADIRLFYVRTVMVVTSPFGPVIYLLALAFPGSEFKVGKKTVILVAALTTAIAFLATTPLVFEDLKNLPQGNFQLFPGLGIVIFGINLIGFMVAGFVTIIRKFKVSHGLVKKQTSYFLAGLILTFTLATLTNFIAVVVFGTVRLTYIGPPLTLIFVGFVTWAIIRHNLLDIRVLVARAVLYALLLLVIVGGYTLLIYTAFKLVPLGIDPNIIFIAIAVIVAFSFNTIKETLAKLTDKIFFKDSYNTERLLSTLTHIMASEIHIKKLTSDLLNTLLPQMRITGGAFIVLEKGEIKDIESSDSLDPESLKDREFSKLTSKNDTIFIFDDLEDEKTKEFFRSKKISIVLPLKVKDRNIGLLVLSQKSSGESYSTQDIEFLQIFAPEVAVALQNAESYEEIQQFSRTLERKVEERTRELKESHAREIAKARQLLKLKDEFVFIATHDLKTPVTAIDGFISLIQARNERFSIKTKNSFKAIVEASDRLKQLVNDLLEVARSESGTIKVEVKPINIVEIIKNAIKEVEPKAKTKRITITTKFVPKQIVVGDRAKIFEVMENLLSNAVNYNKEGGSIEVITQKEGNNLLTKVGDTGIGIPKKDQAQVFQKFFRIKQPGVEGIRGTGLGLFVSRMLVEKMHGKIGFVSVEGKGTTFTFSLPLSNV